MEFGDRLADAVDFPLAVSAGGVAVYTGATGTVADAIEQFKAGKLKQSTAEDVEGHWV